MNIIILIITVFCYAAQSILQKVYSETQPDKGRRTSYLFNMLMTFSAILFFLFVSGGDLQFHVPTLIYGLGFGLCYGMAFLFNLLAVKNGPMSMTALVVSYSLIVPAFYGAIFLHEKVKPVVIIGIALLLLSLLFINKKSEKVIITKKWMVYALIAFLGNGGCSTVQKCHQVAYPKMYQSELMISALLPAFILFCILFAVSKDKSGVKKLSKGLWIPLVAGLCNGVVNLFVMVLSAEIPAVLLFPVISGGGIVVTYFAARFLFKEYLSVQQKIGFFLGTISVIIMNL